MLTLNKQDKNLIQHSTHGWELRVIPAITANKHLTLGRVDLVTGERANLESERRIRL